LAVATTIGLAGIFAADIAGYSRLMAHDEVGMLARLKACRAVIDGLIATQLRLPHPAHAVIAARPAAHQNYRLCVSLEHLRPLRAEGRDRDARISPAQSQGVGADTGARCDAMIPDSEGGGQLNLLTEIAAKLAA
jgi:hypothetical protein